MINSVGKTTATIRLNDYVVNMVNATISDSMSAGILAYDEDNTTLRYTLAINSDGVNSRCLMYARSFAGDSIDTVLRPVLYLPPNVVEAGGGITCIPLYECISPSIACLVNGNYQLTWWSNMDVIPDTDRMGRYLYDYTKIHRFKTNQLGNVESSSSACKILCTAPIHWERLRLGNYDDIPYNTPIVRDIAVLAAISGEGYIVDFATGGSGNGTMRIHNHLNTQEGGFAGAVFMPSSIPRVMSWS